jgi:hypothetical protein
MAHRYEKHKMTKHRTLFVPEGFEVVGVENDKIQPNLVRVVFRKKQR